MQAPVPTSEFLRFYICWLFHYTAICHFDTPCRTDPAEIQQTPGLNLQPTNE